jgi:cytochrome c biogenesis protein CcdA/thiol-disulfide isomerase/thioredoxin
VIVLMAFGLLAGAATALSPCVLPILPVALSAGVTGGRRRPLGIVTGLVLSFTFAIVALVYVIDALGLPGDLLRNIAIVVLLGFGVSLLVPSVAARMEAMISRHLRAPRTAGGEGFGSGLLVGLSLGVVYAPCAGPILAGVITVSAAQPLTAGRLGVALSYAVGSAAVLYALMAGGRRLSRRISPHTGRLQMATGIVMVAVALLMFGDYDTRFQTAIADDLPDLVVNPSKGLEESAGVRERLADVRGSGGNEGTVAAAAATQGQSAGHRPRGSGLPVLGDAPEFVGTGEWFNTPAEGPLTMRALRGRVVLIDFWTYTCINCIRTLPYLRAWDERYRKAGLTIVGIHTPEFPFERDAGNVADAIEQNELGYPVAQDNDYATWTAYGNEYWPAKYLVDARGRVRYTHFGEGAYGETERVIRELLAEAGGSPGAQTTHVEGERASRLVTTPESYLGSARADRFLNGPIVPGTHRYRPPERLAHDSLAFQGTWRISPDSATSVRGARLHLVFGARRVFLVLGSADRRPHRVELQLDGRPIPDALAGRHVEDGSLTVRGQRLYRLVELPRAERHLLSLHLEPGVSGYAFTFG